MHGIRVIRLGAGVIHPGQEETKIARCVDSIRGRACRFFAPRQNEVGAKRGITVCPGLCEMSVGVERERSGVPTDVAFLSNGPIILFNFSIFLPSSIGAIQPFVARGRGRRRTTSSSFTAKRSESFTILGVQVEVPNSIPLARSRGLLRPPVVFIITRSFSVPGSDTLFDELSEMREEDRGR